MPCGDVPGRVHISVAGEGASDAGEEGLALAALRCDMPARRAMLAGVRGTDLLHTAGRFVLQAAYQQAPARGQDAPVQAGFLSDISAWFGCGSFRRAGHASDVQVLDADQVEPARQVRGGLLGPVVARVRLTRFQLRDGQLDPGPASRAALSTCQLALEAADPALPGRSKPGRAEHLARGQRCADRYAPVDASHLAVARRGDRLGDRGEGNMPASGPVQSHPVGLYAWRQLTGPAESHPPGLRYPHLTHVAGQAAHIPLLPALPDDPESLVPAGLAPGRPPGRVAWVEKRGPRLGEVPQRLLLDHLGPRGQPRILGSCLGELAALRQVTRRAVAARAPVRVLLHGQVPDVPGVGAVVPQHRFLGGRGEQPVLGHTNTLAISTDIFLGGEVAFLPRPEGQGGNAAVPMTLSTHVLDAMTGRPAAAV